MPDSGSALQNRFEAAVADVERRWRRLSVPVERLTAKELAAYRANDPVIGWRVPVPFSDQVRRLDILDSRGFPFSPARIALVDRPDFLDWPHVENNGVLCLLPEHSTLSVDDPYGAVANLLMMACDLVESLLQGGRQDELRSEFLSYWGNTATVCNATVLSLVRPGPPARIVRVWQGSNRLVIADSDDILRSWLRNLNRNLKKKDLHIEDGIFAWLDMAPLPSEYPKTAGDFRVLADRGGAADLLDQISQTIPDRLFLLLAAQTRNGPAEVAIVVERPPIVRNNDPLTRGFRPSCIPESVFKMRFFGATPVIKATVERIDPEWVHGRGQDARFARLKRSTVLVLGCGSIGAPVALALGHAGIGRLILADNQLMKSANVGRHPLGVPAINEPKAAALAARLRSDLPHLVVDSHVCKAEDLLHRQDGMLDGVDLIVSGMGNWPADAMLDEWHHSCGRKLPIVYGWTEAHAAAGHAVAILTAGARLRDGVDATGVPHLTVTQWANDPRKQEPACGAAFEPYGPVELGYVTSLVAETALGCILNPAERSIHRIWLGRRSILERAGGQWTPAIQKIAGAQLDGGVILERQWGLDQTAKLLAA